jgi:hypothetical protein
MRRLAPIVLVLALTGCPPPVKPGRTKILEDVPVGGRGIAGADPHAGHDHGGPIDMHGDTTGAGRPMAPPPAKPAEQGVALPLALEGHNSKAQLAREVAAVGDPALGEKFERAFRLTFTADKANRNVAEARALFQEVLAKKPFAPAWRGIAYTWVADGFQIGPAIEAYKKAIEADETYGPAHYGLAFMLGQSDPVTGRKHFERALALGVEDERHLAEQFYPPK